MANKITIYPGTPVSSIKTIYHHYETKVSKKVAIKYQVKTLKYCR